MTKSNTRQLLAAGLSLVAVAGLIACSDDDDSSSGTPVKSAGSIADIASSNSDLTTLTAALEAADLVETLDSEGTFTVFAPTDAAFDALPAGALDGLLADKAALTDVLLYHVADSKFDAAEVTSRQTITTMNGDELTVSMGMGDKVMINDAVVISADIEASNGIIHVIDAVLLPEEEIVNPPGPGTIAEIASDNSDLTTLVTALDAAGLVSTLDSEGSFTVFAPTNAAFAALPAGTLDGLLADTDALTDVLLYHVTDSELDATAVVNRQTIATLNGALLNVSTGMGGTVMINDAVVVTTDIEASNGVIHVIDAVLVPSVEPPAPGSIAEVASEAGNFTTLLAAVEAAGLTGALNGDDPLTVFAPTDDAFAMLPEGTIEALLADTDTLSSILLYHVVSGDMDAAAVASMSLIPTLNGAKIKVEVVDGDVFVGGAQVTMTDIEASNGRIHVIDAVAMPPGDIVDIATSNDDFETLTAAVVAADLVATLQTDGPYTVFAPTDAAFEALPAGLLDSLLNDIPALTSILLYHVVPGEYDAASVLASTSFETAQGSSVAISMSMDGVPMIGDAAIVATDIPARNGVVHVIDSVIVPAE